MCSSCTQRGGCDAGEYRRSARWGSRQRGHGASDGSSATAAAGKETRRSGSARRAATSLRLLFSARRPPHAGPVPSRARTLAFMDPSRSSSFPTVTPESSTQNTEPASALAVWTDTTGYILDATTGAAQLLGVGRRGLVHRLMQLYVTADRAHVLRALERAGRGHEETLDVQLQPRERRKVLVRIHLQFDRQVFLGPVIRWVIHPTTPESGPQQIDL